MQRHAVVGVVRHAGSRLNTLGIATSADQEAFWKLVRVRDGIDRGQTITGRMALAKHFTVLIEGVACFSTQHEDGGRQISAFYYAGDILGPHSFLFTRAGDLSEVQALTNCSVGIVDRDALEQAIQHHPALGTALWRAALTEVSIFRQRLFVSRLPALRRISHLLCEQLVRLGIEEGVIPLSQVEVADASGLSVVHTNRIFQDLRHLGVLSKQRPIEVVNRRHLDELAAFDASYLDFSEVFSRWDLRIDS